MDKVSEYREQAKRCREIAMATTSKRVRAALIDMAHAWERLAEDRKRMMKTAKSARQGG